MRSLLPLLPVFFLVPGTIAAQELRIPARALPEYPRVQIWASAIQPEPLIGPATAADSTRIIVKPRGSPDVVVPIDRIERAEVLAGRDRVKGGLVGLAVGAAVAAIGYKLHADATYANDEWNGFVSLFRAAPIGGAIGLVAGAAIGWDRWQPVVIMPTPDPEVPAPRSVDAGRGDIPPGHRQPPR